jgi:hypothetical protein
MHTRYRLIAALLGLTAAALCARTAMEVTPLLAQVYNGPGLHSGAGYAGVAGVSGRSGRWIIAGIINAILTYVALIAVVTIIVAGLYLIFSLGNDSHKETAKKIVIYTSAGLVLILLSKAIVYFVMYAIQ